MRSPFQLFFCSALALLASGAVMAQTTQAVVEYYDANDDLYFITASPAEQAVIDSGADNVGASTWSRTGGSFNSYTTAGPGNPVCRFFDPNIPPVGIHFYTALAAECAQVQATLPAWQFESGDVFNIPLPVNSACASGFTPVIRYFDQRVNESWRFTTDTTVNAAMLAKGWANEGVQMCAPPASGGGGSTTQNVAAMTVDAGPVGYANFAFVTLTICVPNTTNCQTINNVQVDTGSSGVRIISSLLPSSSAFPLPQENTAGGSPIVECTPFAGSFSWGSMKLADVQIAGEVAHSVPIQIIGDPAFPTIPNDCLSNGTASDTVADFGANGLLGIGASLQDCGTFCSASAASQTYYACSPATSCTAVAVSLAQQTLNPGPLFATDNNGVLLQLPSVPAAGASSVSGSLIFGIGTQANNALGSVQVYTVDTSTGIAGGTLNTIYKGTSNVYSFFDTGSSLYFFNDNSIPQCTQAGYEGLYCPTSTLSLTATNQGLNSVQGTTNFSVGNFYNIYNGNASGFAFNNLAGVGTTDSFDWGLPFFFGRNVFVGFEGKSTPGGPGPYFAF